MLTRLFQNGVIACKCTIKNALNWLSKRNTTKYPLFPARFTNIWRPCASVFSLKKVNWVVLVNPKVVRYTFPKFPSLKNERQLLSPTLVFYVWMQKETNNAKILSLIILVRHSLARAPHTLSIARK